MYEITLDLALIKKIREFNKQMNKTSMSVITPNNILLDTDSDLTSFTKKTGIAGYASYHNMTCSVDSNGSKSQRCKSAMIRQWGVTGCGIYENFSSTKYSKCGTTEKWSMMDVGTVTLPGKTGISKYELDIYLPSY